MKIPKFLFAAIFACFFAAAAGPGVCPQVVGKPITVTKQIKLPPPQELSKIMARERVRLVTLGQSDKLKVANEMLKEKGMTAASSLANPVNLSPLGPRLNDDTYLSYFKPWNVLVTGNNVQFSAADSGLDSALAISYGPPAPGIYMFTLSVRNVNGDGGTEFSFSTIDGKFQQTQKLPATTNLYQNVIFLVNFAEAKQNIVFVFANRGWTFYNCEIAQVKQGGF